MRDKGDWSEVLLLFLGRRSWQRKLARPEGIWLCINLNKILPTSTLQSAPQPRRGIMTDKIKRLVLSCISYSQVLTQFSLSPISGSSWSIIILFFSQYPPPSLRHGPSHPSTYSSRNTSLRQLYNAIVPQCSGEFYLIETLWEVQSHRLFRISVVGTLDPARSFLSWVSSVASCGTNKTGESQTHGCIIF